MKKTPRISIISPIWQAERYLPECVQSILQQSFTDWELLLIDDGSTDRSGEICRSFADRDERIICIRKENTGSAAARNTGLDHCRGEYIAFVDPDDVLLADDYLQCLYDAAKTNDAMAAICDIRGFADKEEIPWGKAGERSVEITSGAGFFRTRRGPKGTFQGSVCNLLFRRECFDSIRFPEGRLAEDNAILHRLLYPLPRIARVNAAIYGYRKRKEGQTGETRIWQMQQDGAAALRDRIRFFEEQKDEAASKIAREVQESLERFYAAQLSKITVEDAGTEITRLAAEADRRRPSRKQGPEISIIVPVYKVEAYLRTCVDSIRAQSFTDWELLLVDDGSPDQSRGICDAYAAGDERIRVIPIEHAGLAAARNAGLNVARGRYIAMVDADDILIDRDHLKILFDAAQKTDAELAVCGLAAFTDGDVYPNTTGAADVRVVSGKELCLHEGTPEGFSFGCAFSKLFRRDCFSDLRYPVGRFAEDNAIAHRLILPLERIATVDARLYGYRKRKSGLMGSMETEKRLKDVDRAFTDRIGYYREQGQPDLAKRAQNERIRHLAVHIAAAVQRDGWERIPLKYRHPSPQYLPVLEEKPGRDWLWKKIRTCDPRAQKDFSRAFVTREIDRAERLLSLAQSDAEDVILGGRVNDEILLSMAEEQGVLPLVIRAADDESKNRWRERADWRIRCGLVTDGILDRVKETAQKEGKALVSPEEEYLRACYLEFWLRGDAERVFLIDGKDAVRWQKIFERYGFSLAESRDGFLRFCADGCAAVTLCSGRPVKSKEDAAGFFESRFKRMREEGRLRILDLADLIRFRERYGLPLRLPGDIREILRTILIGSGSRIQRADLP